MKRTRVYLAVLALSLQLTGCSVMALFRPESREAHHEVDFGETLAFAERAEAAYLEQAEIEARYRGRRVFVEDLPASEVRYFIVFDDRARTQDIGVRGTSNLANVRVDAEFTPEPDPVAGVQLHRGFAAAAVELHRAVKPQLKSDYATTISGHSLGGALAAILGMYLEADGIPLSRIVTFGQPKVTNLQGAQRYRHLPILRLVNRGDPVADVPPLLSLQRWTYTHFGPAVVLWTDTHYIFVEEHQALSAGLLSFWGNLGSHEIAEHKMAAYLSSLRSKVTGAQEISFDERDRFVN